METQIQRRLTGLDNLASDVNPVSPPHDVRGTIAFLAGTVMLERLTPLVRALKPTNEPALR